VIDIAANETTTEADAGHGISFGEAFRVWLRRTDRGDAPHPG
jgi:chromate transporter